MRNSGIPNLWQGVRTLRHATLFICLSFPDSEQTPIKANHDGFLPVIVFPWAGHLSSSRPNSEAGTLEAIAVEVVVAFSGASTEQDHGNDNLYIFLNSKTSF